MPKQSVLFITARSDIGGGPKYTADYARAVAKEYDVFIASPLDLPYGPEFRAMAKAHFLLPHRRFSLTALFGLKNFMRSHGIEIVHSHGRGAGLYSRLLKMFGFKVVHSFHGIHQDPSPIGRVKYMLDHLLDRFTDAFVFVSKSEQEDALKHGLAKGRPFEIVHPLAPPIWKEAPDRYQETTRLGSISRFDHQKGIDLLFKNLEHFHTRYPELEWTFELAGAGSYKFHIPQSIYGRVRRHGAIQKPIDFLRTLDIYLTNSRWESFNITVIEALAQGLPVLISEVPGHEYFIKEGVATGFDIENADEFSEKLHRLMSLPKPEPHFDWIRKNHLEMPVSQIYKMV